jgi:predicted transcriptional regulator of viral defense system
MPRTDTKVRTLGRQVSQLSARKRRVLQLPRDRELLAELGISDLDSLVRMGFLAQTEQRGLYLVRDISRPVVLDQLALVPALAYPNPYFVSWWTALAFHSLTEQSPRTAFVATTKFRSTRQVEGFTYQFVRLSPRKFFGFHPVPISGAHVLIATKAKAVIDAVDHPEYSGGMSEVAKAVASPLVRADDLISAAQRQGVKAVAQRLGWLMENVRGSDASALLGMRNTGGKALGVDSERPVRGEHDRRWNLTVNLDLDSLREGLLT